jgi:hypothetical protein
VLPDVEDEQGMKSGGMSVLVQRDPVVAQPPGLGILVEDRPAYSLGPARVTKRARGPCAEG